MGKTMKTIKTAVSLTMVFCLLILAGTMGFAAAKTYKGTNLAVGYYVSSDGTTGMQVTETKILIYEMYDGKSKMYSEKDALKHEIASDTKGKLKEEKKVIKASTFTLTLSSKNVTIKFKDFSLKMTLAGTAYADAVKLAKKKLDAEFS